MSMSENASKRPDILGAMGFLKDKRARREAAQIAPYLDTAFYLENNTDVAASGLDASYHYVKYGWREGRDPSPSFSTSGYLSAHPSVAMEGTNPLLHFARQAAAPSSEPDDNGPSEDEIEVVANHVDATYYNRTYPKACRNGESAAEHYCRIGWREGHDPAPDFSTSYYLTTNPDIRESGVNPFWHYLIAGNEEGRLPTHPGGWRHGVLSRQTTFEAYCEEWTRSEAAPSLLSEAELIAELDEMRQTSGLLVSIGHDDYRATPGGVQLCVEIEAQKALEHGLDYLNLHPWQPLPKLADAGEDNILCLVLNGELLGAAKASDIAAALPRLADLNGPLRLVVHHLAGHAPEDILALSKGLGIERACLWLHDYFTLCTSYAFQRNNVTPCNVPHMESNACEICIFGKERMRQTARIAEMFATLEIDVISPSEVALDFWSQRAEFQAASHKVTPHVRLIPVPAAETEVEEGPVRIAFIGTPAAHKGWPVFRELQRRLAAEEGYEFWFFGTAEPQIEGLRRVKTHVHATAPDSTLRAIADNAIDLVLHWASWRETLSFSTFEALGGGAFVLTNEGSGNVAAAVENTGCGRVLEDTDALYALAKSGGLVDLATNARHYRATTRLKASFSEMTFDLGSKDTDA